MLCAWCEGRILHANARMTVRGGKICGVGLCFCLYIGSSDQHQGTSLVLHIARAPAWWTILHVDLSLKGDGWCKGGSSHHCTRESLQAGAAELTHCTMLDGLHLWLQSLRTLKCISYPGLPEPGSATARVGLQTDVHSHDPPSQVTEGPELRMRGEMRRLGLEGAKRGNCHFFRSIACESLRIQFPFHKFVNTLHAHRAPALWKSLYLPSHQ